MARSIRGIDTAVATALELAALAAESGTDAELIQGVVDRVVTPYWVRPIAKRAGGTRVLEIPRPELAAVQRVILQRLLTDRAPSQHVYSYAVGRSPVQCAQQHLGAQWLLRVDLAAYFYSITELEVYYLLLREFGLSRKLAFQLARLTTVPGSATLDEAEADLARTAPHVSQYRSRYVAGYAPQLLGHLPHGAPTSGALSNLATRTLDHRLARLADEHGLTYARYSDDLYLTARQPRTRADSEAVLTALTGIVRGAGFTVNPAKTRIAFAGDPKLVLGMHVDGDRLRLRREVRERIDYELHMIQTQGAASHAVHRGDRAAGYLFDRLGGLIAHAHDVDPDWAVSRRERLRSILVAEAAAAAVEAAPVSAPG